MLSIRKISMVNQRRNNDCVVACLSMVTGLDMDFIEKELIDAGGEAPYSAKDYIPFLVRQNIYPEQISGAMGEVLTDDTIYLMLCAGLYNPGTAHMIVGVLHQGYMTILDPNDDLENIKYYSSAKYNNGDIPVFTYWALRDCSYERI